MKFSERIGKKPVKNQIQLDSMDHELKNSLWNVVRIHLISPMEKNDQYLGASGFSSAVDVIWLHFFKEPTDQIPFTSEDVAADFRERFFRWDYLAVYDFIDFLATIKGTRFDSKGFLTDCNFILKRELSGYRFVNGQLAPLTSEEEIQTIEDALAHTAGKLKGTNIHLSNALAKLSDKKTPDYRNSIKESISAVESLCQVITGDNKAELSKALKMLKEKMPIHGALEQAFIKIYGYTSDGDGIRHALSDEHNLDQEDAQFMLISCSAFINYLIVKSQKAGLDLQNK